MTPDQILDPDLFDEIVGPQARAFGVDETKAAIKAAIEEAEGHVGFSSAFLVLPPDPLPPDWALLPGFALVPYWLPDPVARIALYLLSQTAEGWSDAQLVAASRQYTRAVGVLERRRGQIRPATTISGAVVGQIADLPTW